MFKARFINPLKQFGKLNCELLLTDPDGILPDVRQWMKFDENVTDQELLERAEAYIKETIIGLQTIPDIAPIVQPPVKEIPPEIAAIDAAAVELPQVEIDKEGKGTEVVGKGDPPKDDGDVVVVP